MNCEQILEDVDSLLQDPADQDVLGRLEKHFKECEDCREKHGEIINTAAKLSEVGQISDIVDVSDVFIDKTRQEAAKESDRFRVDSIKSTKRKLQKNMDHIILALLIGTVVAAILILYLTIIYL